MKRRLVLLLCICMILSLVSCAGTKAEQGSHIAKNTMSLEQTQPESIKSGQQDQEDEDSDYPSASDSKILIAYFTWADNTQVENPEAVDVDATTSASVLVPGNAAKIAEWIQERTGGVLFSIVVAEPYFSDYDECLNRAADEKARNERPELVRHVDNMEQYDTVFLSFPNWLAYYNLIQCIQV